MDIQSLKEKIESLDPKIHKALKDALTAEYDRLTVKKEDAKPLKEPVSDSFAEMFKKTVDEIKRRYVEGSIDYIIKHHPNLYRKTNEAEDRLNAVWKAGRKGEAGIEEFREALKQWYLLNLKGIEVYSKEHGKQRKS